MLLRVGKRRSSWELTDANDCAIEFANPSGRGLDLAVSAYQLAGSHQVTQTYAEHAASAGLDPPRGGTHADLEGLTPPPIPQPLDGPFAFVRAAHREIHFETEHALCQMVAAVLALIHLRRYEIRKADLRHNRAAACKPEIRSGWHSVV